MGKYLNLANHDQNHRTKGKSGQFFDSPFCRPFLCLSVPKMLRSWKAETLRFFCSPKNRSDFSAIFSAIFWRLSAISAWVKLAICTLRFENASDISAIAIFWEAKSFAHFGLGALLHHFRFFVPFCGFGPAFRLGTPEREETRKQQMCGIIQTSSNYPPLCAHLALPPTVVKRWSTGAEVNE